MPGARRWVTLAHDGGRRYPAYYAPPGMPPQRIQKGVSGFGVASLIVAILAVLLCWLPLLGMIAIPLAIIALLLGFIGLLVSLIGGRSGVGFPVAGAFTAILAIFVQVLVTGGMMAAVGKAVVKAQNSAIRPISRSSALMARLAHPPADGRRQRTRSSRTTSAFASSAHRVAKVKLTEQGEPDSQKSHLAITLEISNLSQSKPASYRGWSGEERSVGRDYATVEDDSGNKYKQVQYGSLNKLLGQVTSEQSIDPGKIQRDILFFEAPVDGAKYLHLELPASNFGGTGMIRFEIPASMLG